MSIVRGKGKLVSRVAGIGIAVVILAFMLRNLCSSWDEVADYDWSLDYRALIIALCLMLLAAAFYAYLWKLILERLGAQLSYRKSYRVFFLSQLGRYLPGKVWGILGLVYLSEREGVSKVISGASVTLQLLLQVVSGIMVFALTLPFWPELGSVRGVNVLVLLLPIGLVALHPRLVNRALKVGLRVAGQPEMEVAWGYRYLLAQLGLWGAFWLANGVAHTFLIESIYSLSRPPVVVLAGIFAVAWVAGFLSLLTPSGLGVMEVTVAVLLAFYLPIQVATVIALWSRLARTLGDLLCAGIAWRM